METTILTVLDFGDGRVYQYEIETQNENLQCEDFEKILSEQGHNISDCEYMTHKNARIYTETINY